MDHKVCFCTTSVYFVLQIVAENMGTIFKKLFILTSTPKDSLGYANFRVNWFSEGSHRQGQSKALLFVFKWFKWPSGFAYSINYLGSQPAPATPLITNT